MSTTMTESAPRFEATDQYDLLALVVDEHSPLPSVQEAHDKFLAACEADGNANGGIVSVSRVAELLRHELERDQIEHHQYSGFWSHYTGKGRPMRKATDADISPPWEERTGSTSGNNGKPFKLRVWVGWPTGEES